MVKSNKTLQKTSLLKFEIVNFIFIYVVFLFQGRIQEFSGGGAQTLFKKKSGGAWAPTHGQVPCLCKNKGRSPVYAKTRERAWGVP